MSILLSTLLRTIRKSDCILFADNASTDNSVSLLREFAEDDVRVQVIKNTTNLGYSKAANQGIRAIDAEFVVLLNPDTAVAPGWIERMLSHFEPGVAAVGPTSDCVAGLQFVRFHLPPEHQAIGTEEIPEALYRLNKGKSLDVRLLIGFCVMLRRSALEDVGLLDEAMFLGSDDLDLCWRLQLAGYRLKIATDVFVHHVGQASFRSLSDDDRRRLLSESSAVLRRKLEGYYGPKNVPSPIDLWGIDLAED